MVSKIAILILLKIGCCKPIEEVLLYKSHIVSLPSLERDAIATLVV
jgi:hypothetical protein